MSNILNMCCRRQRSDPHIDYVNLNIKDHEIGTKLTKWIQLSFNKLWLPITILTLVGLLYHCVTFGTGIGSLLMIIVFACIFLNQMLWLLLRKIWPSQVTKVTLSYCLIHEILTPLLLFNIFGQEALHADDRKIYDWWIDMNFVVANIVAFNDLKFTLGLQIPCYFVASFF